MKRHDHVGVARDAAASKIINSLTVDEDGRPVEPFFSVERTDRADCVLLVIRGALDLPTEGQLLAAVWAIQRQRVGLPIVLDLSGVEFMGSMGFSELLMIRHNATSYDEEVRMVAGDNGRLRRLLDLLGPLPIHNSAADARTA